VTRGRGATSIHTHLQSKKQKDVVLQKIPLVTHTDTYTLKKQNVDIVRRGRGATFWRKKIT